MKCKLLAIETATDACSAALYIDGEVITRFELRPRGHSELIISMMDELLNETGLRLSEFDALGFGRGPGSFTGVRIATAVIQGAAFGAGLPVVPVSTLAALALRCMREQGHEKVLPAYDARMGEIYWGAYVRGQTGMVDVVLPDRISSPEDVSVNSTGWFGVGSGWESYGERLSAGLGEQISDSDPTLKPSAHDIALLAVEGFSQGLAVEAEHALPVYLRDQVAVKPA